MDAGISCNLQSRDECLPVTHVLLNTPTAVLQQLLLPPMIAQLYICVIDSVQR